MRYRSIKVVCYKVLGIAQWVAGAVAVIVPPTLKADLANPSLPELAARVIKSIQAEAWWVVPCAVILAGIAALTRKIIGPPWVWEHIQFLLDRMREAAFPAAECPGDLHHHRVTLFQHVAFCMSWRRRPWSGWLTAVARSGHATQNRKVIFLAPDDADKAEGIAGAAWSKKGAAYVGNLPDLSGEEVTQKMLAQYASATKTPSRLMAPRPPSARSIYAIPVESKGRVWGDGWEAQ